jgi:hypothetical protein
MQAELPTSPFPASSPPWHMSRPLFLRESESILQRQSGWRTQTCPATYCGNLVPARTPMTADPANHQFSDKSRLENSSSEIARHFVPVLMLRPGRRSRAQNSAYQPPAAPLSCAVLNGFYCYNSWFNCIEGLIICFRL